jgi:hypothetical protein
MKPIFGPYTKAIWQAIGAVLTALLPMVVVDQWSTEHIINTVVVATGAFLVWNQKNASDWLVGKAIASGIIAGATLLLTLLIGGVTTGEVVQVVVAFLTTAMVYLFPNDGAVARAAKHGPRAV